MSHPPAEDPWPHAPGVPPQNPYPPHYSAESGNYPPPTQTGRKTIVRRIDVSRLRNSIVRFIGPATPKPNNAPWWNVVAQRREKEAWRKAEEARQRRIGLLIFGVFGVLALIGITVGTLTQDDSADPGSRQAALAAPLASSTTESDDEGVVTPLESPATPTPTSDEPVYYASCRGWGGPARAVGPGGPGRARSRR